MSRDLYSLVLPKVKEYSYAADGGTFVFPDGFSAACPYPDTAEVFLSRMQKAGFRPRGGEAAVFFRRNEKIPEDGYVLRTEPDGVTAEASGKTGFCGALAVLYQLAVYGGGEIPCGVIRDRPAYPVRGIALDTVRHFISAAEIERIVEQCSLLRINSVRLHLSDDQGYRLESGKYPDLNEKASYREISPQDPAVRAGLYAPGERYGGFYTREEIRRLVSFAEARGINLIPGIEMPGHASALLSFRPQYSCSGEPLKVKGTFGVHGRIFCAGNAGTLSFLEDLLEEICSVFPSRYVHIGGDETKKEEWKKCPRCAGLIRQFGSAERVQVQFVNSVCAFLKEKGRIPLVFNESAAGGNLDPAACVQYWTEMNTGESYMIPEIAKNRKILFSNMNEFYCDYSYADIPMRATYCFSPHVKDTPVPRGNVLGIEAPLWTEWLCGDEEMERMLFPRITAVAACGWEDEKDYGAFLAREEAFVSSPALSLLHAMPREEALISGDAAISAILRNMALTGERIRSMREFDPDEPAGLAEAVGVDGGEKADPKAAARAYVLDKMRAAYSEEEIAKVLAVLGI